MKRRSKALLIVLGILLVAVGFVLVGWFPQEVLRGVVERRLRSALGPGSSVARIHAVPGKLEAEVWGLVVDHPSYRLEVPHARLRLEPGFLLRRPLALRSLFLENPTLVLHPPTGPRPPSPPLRDPLVARNVVVTGGTVVYEFPPPEAERLVFRGLSLRGAIGHGFLDVAAAGGEWRREPHPLTFTGGQGRLRVSSRLDVEVERLEVTTPQSRFQVSGSLGRMGDIRPDLRLRAQLDLQEASRIGGLPQMSGGIAVEARVAKEGEEWGASGTVRGSGLRIAGWPLAELEARINRGEPPRLLLEATARLLGGRARADLDLSDLENLREGTLEFEGIDAAALRQQGIELGVPLEGALSGTLTASGPLRGSVRVRADLRADGRLTGGPALDARATLSGSVDPTRRAVSAGFTLDLDASGDAGPEAFTLREAHLEARGRAEGAFPPRVTASFDGTLGMRTRRGDQRVPVTGRGRFAGGTLSLDLTARGFGGTLQADAEMRGAVARRLTVVGSSIDLAAILDQASGQAAFELTASGPFDRLTGAGSLRLDGLVWQGATMGPAAARVQATGGRGTLQFEAPALNARGDGRFDAQGFDGTLVLDQTPLEPLQPFIASDRPLAGMVSGAVQVSFPWSRPAAAEIRAAVRELVVESGTFAARSRAPFRLETRGQRVLLEGLDVEGPGFTFQGGGEIGRSADAPVDLRGQLAVDLTRLSLPPGWTATGTIAGDVQLHGTLLRPQAEGTIAAAGVTVQRPGMPPVTVEDGAVELAGDTAYARDLRATWPGGQATLTGRLPLAALLGRAQAERFGVEATTLDLAATFDTEVGAFPLPPGWDAAGRVQGQLQLRGTAAQPEAEGTLALSGVTFQRPGIPPVTVQDGAVELVGDVVYARGLHATWPGGELNVLGRVPLATFLGEAMADRLGVEPAPFDVEATFELDLASLPARPGWRMSGAVTGDLIFTGTRTDPRAVGLLSLAEVQIVAPGGPLLHVADGTVQLEDDVAFTPGLVATLAGGTVTVEGSVPLAAALAPTVADRFRLAPGEADLHATWRNVEAGLLLDAMRPGRMTGLRAQVSGDATLQGRFTSIRTLTGNLRLEPTALRLQETEIGVSALDARLQDGVISTTGLELTGAGGTFRADGQIDLGARTVQAAGRGRVELRALSPLLDEASMTGIADVDLTVTGPLGSPRPQGTVQVLDGTLRLRQIRQPFTGIEARLEFSPGLVRVAKAGAVLGGGPITASGEGRLEGLRLAEADFTISGRDIGIRYPVGNEASLLEDLNARVDADLTLTGEWGDFLLSGSLTAERSLYDADIFLEEGLLAPDVPPGDEDDARSPFLQSVGLDLLVATENPFLVRNNLAQLEADGAIWVRGSLEDPAPFGRFELRPGGKVFLQEREFAVESGSLSYSGSLQNPEILVRAATVIDQPEGEVQVTIVAEGPLERPSLRLSSDPSYSEQEIASLIATGRTNVALDTGAWIVGEQAAALLAGRFTRRVARELLDLGLDQVEIQPQLLAREGEPSARFTFGKDLTSDLRLVYSWSLSEPEAQYYQALFRLRQGQDLSARLQNDPEAGYTFGLGQRFRFGGTPLPEAQIDTTTLAGVRFEGTLREFPELAEVVRADPGDEVTYFDLLEDADRAREHLAGLGYLEAVVDSRLEAGVAVFGGATGLRYAWRIEGMTTPPDLGSVFRDSLFEEEAIERGRQVIIDELRARGHLRGIVEVDGVREDGVRTLAFRVEPGPVLQASVGFPGAASLSHRALLEAAGGAAELLTSPVQAEQRIREAYREEHFLSARVGPTQVTEGAGQVSIVVPVEEGPGAVVTQVRFEGATLPEGRLRELAALETGGEYDPLAVSEAVLRLRDHYLTLGYPAVRVNPRVEPVEGNLAVVMVVAEGQRQVVGPIRVTGLRRTSESWIRSQIELEPAEPLDPRRLAETERRLRDLGIFRRVVVTASDDSPATITIEAEEGARFVTAYDARYNEREGVSGLVDAEVENLLGRGLSLGARVRAGRSVREVRGSFYMPDVGPGDLSASYARLWEAVRIVQEVPPAGVVPLPVEGTRTQNAFQLQQALRGRYPWDFLYGARFDRTTCPSQGLPPLTRRRRGRLFDPCENSERNPLGPDGRLLRPTLDIALAEGSVVRDTRDSPLSPTRGSFVSLNAQASRQWLGSDFDFYREFLQASFLHDVTRTSLIYAHGYRIGLIQTLEDQRLPFDALFKAGGPNSVRGFELDSLGPRGSITGEALGGEAVIILNQELRYHHPSGLGAAVFWDAGNVFATAGDVSLKLRHSAGVGLRYDSPLGLLRFDVAFPLDRRDGERSHQFSFGLGQAF